MFLGAGSFFFTANQVETERWLDQIAHAMIQYNKAEPADIEAEYKAKEDKVATSIKALQVRT